MKSIFIKKQGDTPKNRILDFLIVHQEFDYSLKDIAKFSGIGYTTLKKMQKELIQAGWMKFTRMVGKAKMYKLNLEDQVVVKFMAFYWQVIESELGLDETKNTYSGSGPAAVPASAHHF